MIDDRNGLPPIAALRANVRAQQQELQALRDSFQPAADSTALRADLEDFKSHVQSRGALYLTEMDGWHPDNNSYPLLRDALLVSKASGRALQLPPGRLNLVLPANKSIALDKVAVEGAGRAATELLVTWTTDYWPIFDVVGPDVTFRGVNVRLNPQCSVSGSFMFKWRAGANDLRIEDCALQGRVNLASYANYVDHCMTDGMAAGMSSGLYILNNFVKGFRFFFMQDSNSLHAKSRLRFLSNYVEEVFSSSLGINSPSAKLTDAVWRDNTCVIAEAYSASTHVFGIDVAGGEDITIESNHFQGDFIDALHIEESTRQVAMEGNTGVVNRNAISYMDGDAAMQDTLYRSPRRNKVTGNIFVKANLKNGATGSWKGFNGVYRASGRGPLVDSIVSGNIMAGFQDGFYYGGLAAQNVLAVARNADEGEQPAVLSSPGKLTGNTAIDCGVGFRVFDAAMSVEGNRSVRCQIGAVLRSSWVKDHTFEQCPVTAQKDAGSGSALRGWSTITDVKALTASGTVFALLSGLSQVRVRSVDIGLRAQSKTAWAMFGSDYAATYTNASPTLSLALAVAGSALNLTVTDSTASVDGYVMAVVDGTAVL